MSSRKFNFFCLLSLFSVQLVLESLFRAATHQGNFLSSITLVFFFVASIFLGWYGLRLKGLKQSYLGLYFGLSCWSVEESLERIKLASSDTQFCPTSAEHPFFWVRFEHLPFALLFLFIYFLLLDFRFSVSNKLPLHLQVAFPFLMSGWILTGLSRGNRTIFLYRGPGAYIIISFFIVIFLSSIYQLFKTRKEAGAIFAGITIASFISTVFGLISTIKANI